MKRMVSIDAPISVYQCCPTSYSPLWLKCGATVGLQWGYSGGIDTNLLPQYGAFDYLKSKDRQISFYKPIARAATERTFGAQGKVLK